MRITSCVLSQTYFLNFLQAPLVVFKDADIPSAVAGAAFACFIASGQTCVSGTRLIIQDEIYDEFMERFLKKVESITARMGNRMCLDARMLLTRSLIKQH